MPDMHIIFVRHGQRHNKGKDCLAKLTQDGAENVHKLQARFHELNIAPTVFFTSSYVHAKETTTILSEGIPNAKVIEVEALTPRTDESLFTIENIISKATENNLDLKSVETVAFVGHENRLSQLITLMTGTRLRPLDLLDVVCVKATSLTDLRLGRGRVAWRIPVRAYQEAELRPKIASKMTVATFLAGFTFTALIELFINVPMPKHEDLIKEQTVLAWICLALPLIATIFLTAAIAFFVATVYIYDRLSMPEGFWGTSRAPKWENLPKMVQKNKDQYGLIYGHMLHIWTRVFTPGVILATIGFLLIAVNKVPSKLSVFYLLVVIFVGLYYWRVRPTLGVD